MAQHVSVKEYNFNYPLMFEKEKEILIKILNPDRNAWQWQ